LATVRRKAQHPFAIVAQDRLALRTATHGVVPTTRPTDAEVAADIFALIEAFALQQIRRYFHHRFWENESIEAEFADRAEPGVKLENVAAHSWHVADATLLLLGHFEWLDRERCLALAILHDKLEMYTGDANPVGRDGTGSTTHAFDEQAKLIKNEKERNALLQYTSSLRSEVAESQARLLMEIIEGTSEEARLIKAIDRLQALAFVHVKKRGDLLDSHVRFTLRYSKKCCEYFPQLYRHYNFLKTLFLKEIATRRNLSAAQLERDLFSQLELDFYSCEGSGA
jgi:5'-deoxynucleotidase YfbR-like HD superfamily hydrolase